MSNALTTLQAWNHSAGETCEIEVPAERAAPCAILGAISSRFMAELLRGARTLTETRGGVSMTTANGWTISR